MHTKLTLRLDHQLIRQAKSYARRSGKSVSQIVAEFFTLLLEPDDSGEPELTPKVRSLLGALSENPVSERDYYQYLEKKYL